ncbi:hypothetical protein EZS27_025023 [termite gut metagenome]|jgi:hypothetical protein|uniref:Polyketide cyclase n=1 Tax=termite gut metagenome TaxID=433724 RepID=A0A5J4QZC9_9ZZZZ|nr:SRPBCC family protein [Mediterranea sp.]
MTQFESSIKTIPYNQKRVYAKLSDLSNLESIKDKIPPDKINGFSFDTDTFGFNVDPVGNLTLKIIEREPSTSIKFETVQSPLPFNLWIQIVPFSEEACKIKLTLRAEINMLMKSFVQTPLQEGLERIAEMMTTIEY